MLYGVFCNVGLFTVVGFITVHHSCCLVSDYLIDYDIIPTNYTTSYTTLHSSLHHLHYTVYTKFYITYYTMYTTALHNYKVSICLVSQSSMLFFGMPSLQSSVILIFCCAFLKTSPSYKTDFKLPATPNIKYAIIIR